MTQENEEQAVAELSPEEIWNDIDREETGAVAPAKPSDDAAQPQPQDDGQAGVEAEPAGGESDNDDPYADLPPRAREVIKSQQQTIERLAQSQVRLEGSLGGLKGFLQQRLSQLANTTQAAGSETPSGSQINEATKSPEALKRLMEDYPEFGSAVKEVLDVQAQEIASLRGQLGNAGVSREEFQKLVVEQEVSAAHPGWKRRVTDPGFSEWLVNQPREVQALANSKDPADAIRLLDLDREARDAASSSNVTQQARQAQRQATVRRAATIPAGKSSSSIKSKDLDSMSAEELWNYLDATEGVR